MTDRDWRDLAWQALSWLGYCALHSAFASLQVKRWVALRHAELMPLYRIAFNALALLLLLPLQWLLAGYHGPGLWAWQGTAAWAANGLALAALLAFMISLKHYDGREFLGLRQWQERSQRVEDQEGFHLSPFHRYVRHPWYFFSLVLVWTRDMNAATLMSGAMITAYFIVGSRLEEAKLVAYHGAVYRRYMERVPGLIPLPWMSLSAKEAAELVQAAWGTDA